jgi:hypothetical protein
VFAYFSLALLSLRVSAHFRAFISAGNKQRGIHQEGVFEVASWMELDGERDRERSLSGELESLRALELSWT